MNDFYLLLTQFNVDLRGMIADVFGTFAAAAYLQEGASH
jgi:hypothetical protein